MKRIFLSLLMMCAVCLPLRAFAALLPFQATLNGLQEVPANASPATGSASILFDDVTKELSWNISFSDLMSAATAAHFHGPAGPGVNASVQAAIPGVMGLVSGTVSGSALLTLGQEADLFSELFYINIHTSVFPGGEIRGQVLRQQNVPVPEPATTWLMGSTLLGWMAWRKKRQQAQKI